MEWAMDPLPYLFMQGDRWLVDRELGETFWRMPTYLTQKSMLHTKDCNCMVYAIGF